MAAIITDRREILLGMAALTAISIGGPAVTAAEKSDKITGKGVGDFDFLTGEWTIQNKRLKDDSKDVWEEFPGAATVHSVMGGQASIEELRIPADNYRGMGIRVWRPKEKKWTDHWTGAYDGVINQPQLGEFIDGEGVFISEETVDGVNWLYRGVWDRITPTSCRWHQSSSSDGGKAWEWNWYMDWTRVS